MSIRSLFLTPGYNYFRFLPLAGFRNFLINYLGCIFLNTRVCFRNCYTVASKVYYEHFISVLLGGFGQSLDLVNFSTSMMTDDYYPLDFGLYVD